MSFVSMCNAVLDELKGIVMAGAGHATQGCPRWALGIRFPGNAQGECRGVDDFLFSFGSMESRAMMTAQRFKKWSVVIWVHGDTR